MKITPKVSVIVPVYNSEKYLNQCVDSIVAQTLTNIEVILVDDGSTDNSPAICDGYATKDSRIEVIHKKNEGMGVAYNTGMAAAKGEYIGFVETDDWIEPKMYEKLYAKAIEQDVDVVKSLHTEIQNGEKRHICKFNLPRDCNKRKTNPLDTADLCYSHISHWSAIYRRSFIVSKKIEFPTTPGASAQDIGFNWRVYVNLESYFILPECFYNYRLDNPDQSMNQGWATAIKVLDAHREVYEWSIRNRISHTYLEVSGKAMFLLIPFNLNTRCHGFNKIRYILKISGYLRDYFPLITLKRLTPMLRSDFIRVAFHPLFFLFKGWFFKCERVPNINRMRLMGIKVFEKKKEGNKCYVRILGIPCEKEISEGPLKRNYFMGIPYASAEQRGDKITKRFLGACYKIETVAETQRHQEIRMLRIACAANAVSELHQKTFPKYRDCHIGQDVMIVACGPTVTHAPVIPNIKYLAVNHAITIEKYRFDYCFMIDYDAVKGCIDATFNYGCVNFFGKYICSTCINKSIPDAIATAANAERFYSEVPHAIEPYHDVEHFPLFDFCTIVHCALHFLLYTRPRRIYLAGCDTSNKGYFEKNRFQKPFNCAQLKLGYTKLKELRDIFYPEIEIVSINPVGLKGVFKDMYTRSYLDENPEIKVKECDIIR